jgi:hypothetical protein
MSSDDAYTGGGFKHRGSIHMNSRIGSRLGVAALAILVFSSVTAPARADDSDGYSGSRGSPGRPGWMNGQNPHARQGQWPDHHQEPRPRPDIHRGWPPQAGPQAHGYGWHTHEGRSIFVPVYRTRYYRDVVVIRRYGHVYPGYGYYHDDDDAYRWLAFTAITLKILDNLNEAQERAHEQAQAEATMAPVGDTIIWNQSGASGAVSVLRDGYSTSGRYCREFQQQVTIGGQTEWAYGTACQQPAGSWQVVSTGS